VEWKRAPEPGERAPLCCLVACPSLGSGSFLSPGAGDC